MVRKASEILQTNSFLEFFSIVQAKQSVDPTLRIHALLLVTAQGHKIAPFEVCFQKKKQQNQQNKGTEKKPRNEKREGEIKNKKGRAAFLFSKARNL